MPDEVIVEELSGKNGLVGRLILNRPQALNALNKNMCQAILNALEKWEKDPKIKRVLIKGAGDKAFCAGGDIRQVYEAMQVSQTNPDKGLKQGSSFFTVEYAMNKALYHFKKPYFSLLNGITMGGGVGVSIHGRYRIATEKLRLAMPETLIGFYPDVGAGYHLVRCPSKFGWYLALSGNTIGAAEALHFGLCTHFVPSLKILDLENALMDAEDESVLQDFTKNEFPVFAENDGADEKSIEAIFTAHDLEEVLEKLEKNETLFAKNTLEVLRLRSPLSLKVTWAHLKHCEKLSFDELIKENYAMTLQFLKGHDFLEGVRAQIIDKDKRPKWQPATLSDVTEAEVAAYFN